ncbi:MAG TPA: cytochrome c oxidase assembly protein [Burkholderiales bacterium]
MNVKKENRRLSLRLAIVALGMFAFGFALVPFYDQICAAVGLNSLVEKSDRPANSQVDATRTVTIELDSNTATGLPWQFRPLLRHVKVHPGEMTTVEYEIVNTRSERITGQAVASYGPQFAGEYFKKIECFCFTHQTLEAGETRRLPVVFVIDPKLPRSVNSIALSYTFFEVAGRDGKS